MSMTTPTPGQPLSEADVSLLVKLIDTLKPLAEVAEKLKHCHVVEICEPTPDNPSRNIIPMPREWFERAADDLEALAIQLHHRGVLSEGQASKITGLDRVEVRKLADAYRPHAPVSRPDDGVEGADDATRCDRCNGDGYVYPNGIGDGHNVQEVCPTCEGAGGYDPVVDAAWVRETVALNTPPAEPVSRPAGGGEREAVARIIDLTAFEPMTGHTPVQRQKDALTKADAILSLLRPAAPDAGGGWMPIETAPDQRHPMFVVRAFEVRTLGGLVYTSDPACVWRNLDGSFARWSHDFQPTHWMPLPAPPALQPGGER